MCTDLTASGQDSPIQTSCSVNKSLLLSYFFSSQYPKKAPCCGSFGAKHLRGTKTTFLPPEIQIFFWPSPLLKFPIQQTSAALVPYSTDLSDMMGNPLLYIW